jgi:hypothetical protein
MLEEFEERLITGLDKISGRHLGRLAKPQTIAHMEYEVRGLLYKLGQLFGFTVQDKVLVKIEINDYGNVTIGLLKPHEPIYDYYIEGGRMVRGRIIDHHRYRDTQELLSTLLGIPYESLYSSH